MTSVSVRTSGFGSAALYATLVGVPRFMFAPALKAFLLLCVMCGCERGPAARLISTPEYEPEGQSKCNVQASPTRPLVVEWPAADRASLEARLKAGLVAVRAEGCEIEVLRQCRVPGSYAYRGLTRKNDQVVITNADELYAQLPIGALRLESKLARSGKLDVHMALVGMLEAPAEPIMTDKLSGDCHGATHVIAGVQLGAFEFFAGGNGEVGAGIGVGQAGAGGRSTASKELLSADGDPQRCAVSSVADVHPPDGCGAVIRIELARLGVLAPPRLDPACPPGSRWDGQRCVITETFCPSGNRSIEGRCVDGSATAAPADGCPLGMVFQKGHGCVSSTATAPRATSKADIEQCRIWCGKVATCDAKRPKTMILNEMLLKAFTSSCQEYCERKIIDDVNRSEWSKCYAGDCEALNGCIDGRL